jgi:hypothetical protein
MKISLKFTNQEWDLFTYDIIQSAYKITIADLQNKLESYKGIKLSDTELKNLWEAYKVSESDSIHPISERLVNVKDLVSTKLGRKSKRIDELI